MEKTNFSLPTPQMLIKKAKEETIPVSLRVKESTVAIFDNMAKEAGVNRGVMMNTWLDFYAQNQGASNSDNSLDIMISFLNSERYWKSIPTLTSEELIYRIPSLVCNHFYLNGDLTARDLYASYEAKGFDDDVLLAMIDDGDTIYPTDGDPKCDTQDHDNSLYVKLEQWPLVTVLLGEYRKKYERLFPDQEYAITSGMYQKIAQACKKHAKPDSELAAAIKSILLEFVVMQNDKID